MTMHLGIQVGMQVHRTMQVHGASVSTLWAGVTPATQSVCKAFAALARESLSISTSLESSTLQRPAPIPLAAPLTAWYSMI